MKILIPNNDVINGYIPSLVKGYQNAQWILLDFGVAIVHVFQKEIRDFYQLEDLWADGKFKTINDE